MRISDWSSDVCSSDLLAPLQGLLDHRAPDLLLLAALFRDVFDHLGDEVEGFLLAGLRAVGLRLGLALARAALALRLLLGVAFAEQVVVVDELVRSEEHTSELQSLMRITYAVFCLKQNK